MWFIVGESSANTTGDVRRVDTRDVAVARCGGGGGMSICERRNVGDCALPFNVGGEDPTDVDVAVVRDARRADGGDMTARCLTRGDNSIDMSIVCKTSSTISGNPLVDEA